ncbi:MAG: hypothetical protein U0573_08525 [Phycisphaerales bacterium]|nr:hypothetical protein [Planctomycetota bacterium]
MLTQITRVGIVALVAGIPGFALAQMKDVAPYPAIVVTASADMHSGDTAQFYRVGEAKQGVIVIVDGESANWSRISYPAGSYAFVPADDATYDAATKTLKLSKNSRLRAPNPTSGFAGSWKALVTNAIPAGTSMNVLQVEEASNGAGVVAYRVAAPAEARAFTESKNLRKATADEVNAFRSKGGAVPDAAAASAPAPSPTAPVAAAPVAAAPSKPVDPVPVKQPEPAKPDTSLVTPINTSGTAGAPPAPAPVSISQAAAPAGTTPTSSPASTSPAPSPAPAAAPAAAPATAPAPAPAVATMPAMVPAASPAPVSQNMRTAARIKELDQAFDRVNAQPLGEAEYETLIVQYEKAIQDLSGQASPRQRALLEQRLNILKFRKDLREQQLALLNGTSADQQRNQQVLQNVAQVEATRVYSIVGQLQPSTVYNGDTLPLMYRIQSVGTSVPRTLGYIKPDPRFALDGKLGQIVGVIGEASVDKDLKLNVITPVRVDLLQGVPVQPTQQAPVQIPAAPSGQLPPVQMPEQAPPKQSVIEVTK